MSETYRQKKWDLTELFPGHDSREMRTALERAEELVADLEKIRSDLAPDIAPAAFLDMIRRFEDFDRLASRIGGFAGLLFAEDTQDQAILAFQAQVQDIFTGFQNRLLFFELWWIGLSDEEADRLTSGAGPYQYWLEKMRLFKPHTLSEPEEKIINLKDVTGTSALVTLYETITTRYAFNLEIEGESQELTREELMVFARHHNPELRAAAYQELYRVYGEDGPILGQMYQTLVRDWRNEQIGLRGHHDPIAVRNLSNHLPDETIGLLLDVCRENASVFQRYFRLKARWINLERLRRYDLYAPVAESEKTYPFDTAVQMVLDAYNEFDPAVADMARRVFDNGHIDSEIRKGKLGGAFCASIDPGLTPWVLQNYKGKANDVATMAHELGHAVHSMLAADKTLFTFHAPLPLAETASIFGEMLLLDRLLALEDDEAVRRDMLFRQLDDAYATVMRQAFFALFEIQAHEMIPQGATVDELAAAYLENLHSQFGQDVDVGEEFRWEWVSIPHIYHTPFYVYAYSFGQLLVLSLYRKYKEDPQGFRPGYIEILAAGGSRPPLEILERAGLDIQTAEFWQGGFEVVRGLLDRLEAIPVRG